VSYRGKVSKVWEMQEVREVEKSMQVSLSVNDGELRGNECGGRCAELRMLVGKVDLLDRELGGVARWKKQLESNLRV